MIFLFRLIVGVFATLSVIFSPALYAVTNEEFETLKIQANTTAAESIVEGETALSLEIVDVTIDAETYQQGDTANISFSWSSPMFTQDLYQYYDADTFPTLLFDVVMSSDSVSCAKSATKKVYLTDNNKFMVAAPITADCPNPTVSVVVNDSHGVFLGEWTFTEPNIVSSPSRMATELAPVPTSPVPLYVIGILFVASISLIIWKRLRRQGSFVGFLLAIFILSGTMIVSSRAEAASVTWHQTDSISGLRLGTYTVSTDKNSYQKGDFVGLKLSIDYIGKEDPATWEYPMFIQFPMVTYGKNYYFPYLLSSAFDGHTNLSTNGKRYIEGVYTKDDRQAGLLYIPENTDKNYTLTFMGCIPQTARVNQCSSADLSIPLSSPSSSSPMLIFTANPKVVEQGKESSTLSWRAENVNSCRASHDWSGDKMVSGSESTGPLNSMKTFSLTCTGESGSVTRTVTVNVNALTSPPPPPPPPVRPTLDLVALGDEDNDDRITIKNNEKVSLVWTSTEVVPGSCSVYGGWNGVRVSNGSEVISAIQKSTSFSIECIGKNASSIRDTVFVDVIANGSCGSANGGAFSSAPTTNLCSSGTPFAVTGKGPWSWACAGSGGGSTASCQATRVKAPTLTFYASPTTVYSGFSSTLYWWTTNATSCTASADWRGTKGVSGSESTGPLKQDTKYHIQHITANKSYTLTCVGPGGTTTGTATVSVSTLPPTSVSQCSDGVDNDGNGYADMADSGCSNSLDNDESSVTACSDNLDNDGDGQIDMADVGCSSSLDNSEQNEGNTQCSDGIDNDGDGHIDTADGGCTDWNDNNEVNNGTTQCSDGIDNDGDGLVDYPDDTGCVNAADNKEKTMGSTDYLEF